MPQICIRARLERAGVAAKKRIKNVLSRSKALTGDGSEGRERRAGASGIRRQGWQPSDRGRRAGETGPMYLAVVAVRVSQI